MNAIKTITTHNLRCMKDSEGLILQGCGGDLTEWLDGINKMLTRAGILLNGTKFESCFTFTDEKLQLTCLLFLFDEVELHMGKLAIWRLRTHDSFGGTWLSDYVPNRLGGFYGEEEEDEEEI